MQRLHFGAVGFVIGGATQQGFAAGKIAADERAVKIGVRRQRIGRVDGQRLGRTSH